MAQSKGPSRQPKGARWKIHLFRGIRQDLKRRAPYYASDFRDAWDYRVIPAIVYMICANILPALAFSLDLYARTGTTYGVNETLLASVVGCVMFGMFAAQPLVIAGVTGPITVFNYTVYEIVTPLGIPYLPFMAWISIWTAILHWILAITNACNSLRYVTKSFGDTFGFYVATIYLQKGIEILIRQFNSSSDSGSTTAAAYLSITIALLMVLFGYGFLQLGNSSLFRLPLRTLITDYGTVLALILFTGISYLPTLRSTPLTHLPTTPAYLPTSPRPWFVPFYTLPPSQTFLALPFAALLTLLFFFDHNISSLLAQATEFPLKKPAGFHWDLALLGLTTLIAGLLGLPAPNGLIPQAPFHTAALCVREPVRDLRGRLLVRTRNVRVVEQRVSNTGQGLVFLLFMTGPLLSVLARIPQGVLAGLFFIMALQALQANGITGTVLFLMRDRALTAGPDEEPLLRVRRGRVWAFLAYQVLGFGATLAITESIAAIGFPVVIIMMVPVRAFLLPRFFEREELEVLDQPVASDFTAESFGGMDAGFGRGKGEVEQGSQESSCEELAIKEGTGEADVEAGRAEVESREGMRMREKGGRGPDDGLA